MTQISSAFRPLPGSPKRTPVNFQGRQSGPAETESSSESLSSQHSHSPSPDQPNHLALLARHLLDTIKPTSEEAVEKASNEKLKQHIAQLDKIDANLSTYLKARPGSQGTAASVPAKSPQSLRKSIHGIVAASHELPGHVKMLKQTEERFGDPSLFHKRVEDLQTTRVQLYNSLDLLNKEAELFKPDPANHRPHRLADFTDQDKVALEETRHHLQRMRQKLAKLLPVATPIQEG